MVKRHGAGHFIGMDGRLHVDLGPCTRFAKTEHGNSAVGARGHAGKLNGFCLNGHEGSFFESDVE